MPAAFATAQTLWVGNSLCERVWTGVIFYDTEQTGDLDVTFCGSAICTVSRGFSHGMMLCHYPSCRHLHINQFMKWATFSTLETDFTMWIRPIAPAETGRNISVDLTRPVG